MSAKYLIPAILVSLLAGCASTNVASATDPVRSPSEADYVYPNWVVTANPAGTIMTDGHPELATVKGGGSAQ
jgi:hypothetical protein